MYALHDNGRALFDSARTCTPMQRFLYVMAKNEHEEDPREPDMPARYDKAKRFQQSTRKF